MNFKGFLEQIVEKFRMADRIIKGLNAQYDASVTECSNYKSENEKLKALNAALEAGNAEEAEAAKAALAEIEGLEVPAISAEAEVDIAKNDTENDQQFEDVIPELAIAEPAVDFAPEEAPTAGTPEETTTEVVDAAIEAIAEAVESEELVA